MASSGKVSFGFKAKPIASTASAKAQPPTAATPFADDDDDEGEGDDRNHSGPSQMAPQPHHKGSQPSSKASRHLTTQALDVDSKIYDYDGVYDSLKSHETAKKVARQAERSKRDPKYIEGMLDSVKERNKLLLRAQAKKTQREREEEGDLYAGGEEFVTDAYREQMEEMRRVEEEEKRDEELEMQKRRGDMSGFYKDVMQSREAEHQAAMQAVESGSSAIETPQVEPQQQHQRPRHAQTNDDGELIDQRSILNAGLNVLKTHKSKPGDSSSRDTLRHTRREQPPPPPMQSRREARQRSSRAIEDQIIEMEERKDVERAREEEERKRKLVGERRNDQSKVEQAKRRMEERKRRRVEGGG